MPEGSPTSELRIQDVPKDFFRISGWRAPLHVALTWLGIATTVVLCGALDSPLGYFGGAVLIAGFQNCLMVLFHHSIHNNMHPRRPINHWIARWLLISPMGQPWGMMRRAHLTHHTYLGEENDPDRWYYDLELHGRRNRLVLVAWLTVNCLGGLILPQLRKMFTGRRDAENDPGTESGRRDRIDQVAVLVAQSVLFLSFWWLGGAWWTYFALWAVPAATLGSGLNCLRTALEHADPGDPPRRNYSFRSNPVERFFVAPFYMNYHWEHHKLMTIPYYEMPRLQRWLLDRDQYGDAEIAGSYLGRLRQIYRELGSSATG